MSPGTSEVWEGVDAHSRCRTRDREYKHTHTHIHAKASRRVEWHVTFSGRERKGRDVNVDVPRSIITRGEKSGVSEESTFL